MKTIKITSIIFIFLLILIGIARVFDFINQDQAVDFGLKSLTVLAIIVGGGLMVGLIMGQKKVEPTSENHKPNSGPKF